VLCRDDDAKFPPKNCFFHRQADSHYASNLNHKVYAVMRIEDKKKPAYLLGYAYDQNAPKVHTSHITAAPAAIVTQICRSTSERSNRDNAHCHCRWDSTERPRDGWVRSSATAKCETNDLFKTIQSIARFQSNRLCTDYWVSSNYTYWPFGCDRVVLVKRWTHSFSVSLRHFTSLRASPTRAQQKIANQFMTSFPK
jgi:hypothetical protein